jgi:hypothetical protein
MPYATGPSWRGTPCSRCNSKCSASKEPWLGTAPRPLKEVIVWASARPPAKAPAANAPPVTKSRRLIRVPAMTHSLGRAVTARSAPDCNSLYHHAPPFVGRLLSEKTRKYDFTFATWRCGALVPDSSGRLPDVRPSASRRVGIPQLQARRFGLTLRRRVGRIDQRQLRQWLGAGVC